MILRQLRPQLWNFARLLRDEAGAVAIMAAAMFPIVIGGIGFGGEVGFWYFKGRQLQHAADMSAHAAGTRRRAGDSQAQIKKAALQIATKAGFDPDAGTLTVLAPPTTGENAGNPDAVEIRITRAVPRLFTALFNKEPVKLDARAVALLRDGQEACVLALDPTASAAVKLSGSSLVELNGCDLASNSMASDSILMNGGSASLKAGCVYAVGEIVETTRLTLTECDTVKEYASVSADPYASVAEPANIGSVPVSNLNTGNINASHDYAPGVKAMRFTGGLTLRGAVNFGPGLYIIDGGTFRANANTVINGSGVTFYITNRATVQLNGSATLDLSPPTTGLYSGLTFFGSRSGTNLTHQVNGNSGSVVEGAVLFSEIAHPVQRQFPDVGRRRLHPGDRQHDRADRQFFAALDMRRVRNPHCVGEPFRPAG
jgi:hypothetical protein